MSQERPHVLVWVVPQFLQSNGMGRILREAEFFSFTDSQWDRFVKASEETGGFAIGGRLVESNHGAGIWVAPLSMPGLELMIPWSFIRSVVTARDTESVKMFGLLHDMVKGPLAPHGNGHSL